MKVQFSGTKSFSVFPPPKYSELAGLQKGNTSKTVSAEVFPQSVFLQTSCTQANWFSNVELIELGYIYFLDSENMKRKKIHVELSYFRALLAVLL